MIIPNPSNLLRVPIVTASLLLTSTLAFSDTYTVTNTDDGGADSLREAIESANSNPGLDLIDFDIPGDGLHIIRPATALPDINDSVVIDGYTQPGAVPADGSVPARLRIAIDGTNAVGPLPPHFNNCLTLHSDNNTVRGLVINRCDDAAIHIDSPNGGNVIEGNYLGTNSTGSRALSNYSHGVRIWDSPYNRIGGTSPAARNIISGNGFTGVEILLPGAMFNQVEGNYIGITASGIDPLGNGADGVHIKEGAGNNTIGPDNVISSSGQRGIHLDGGVSPVNGNTIVANLVGTDALGNGKPELGNAPGMRIYLSDDNSVIGNIVSSSEWTNYPRGSGVVVLWSNDNTFWANTAKDNRFHGFRLVNSSSNTFKENMARDNGHNGFSLSTGSSDNTLKDNTVLNNGSNGFLLESGFSGNTLKDNTATDNLLDGFSVQSEAVGNTLKENFANENGGYGYSDDSSGTGTSGTANKYKANKCEGNLGGDSSPGGLCSTP